MKTKYELTVSIIIKLKNNTFTNLFKKKISTKINSIGFQVKLYKCRVRAGKGGGVTPLPMDDGDDEDDIIAADAVAADIKSCEF
jgi:hypothetical protein